MLGVAHQAVVRGDDHHAAAHGELLTGVQAELAVAADGPGPTEDPEHYGTGAAPGAAWRRVHTEVEAVFHACEERNYKGLHAFPSNITRDDPPITRDYPPSLLIILLQGRSLTDVKAFHNVELRALVSG